MDNDGFQLVRGKKASKIRNHRKVNTVRTNENETVTDDINFNTLHERIKDCACELRSSQFLIDLRGILSRLWLLQSDVQLSDPEPATGTTSTDCAVASDKCRGALQGIVCYGLGSVISSVIARYQLTLLIMLRDDLMVKECFVYDPIWTEADKKILASSNVDLITINEEACRKVQTPTLFFMPHCDKALYNNLLWANWRPECLVNLYILGNSFSQIGISTPARFLEKEGHHILRILPYTTECRIGNNFCHTDVFNDLSLHYFMSEKLMELGEEFWEVEPRPVYDSESDIILNNNT